LKEQFIAELKAKVGKVAKDETNKEETEIIIDNIKNYVMQKNNEYVTTQHVIGMEILFKEWVVKNWFDMQQK